MEREPWKTPNVAHSLELTEVTPFVKAGFEYLQLADSCKSLRKTKAVNTSRLIARGSTMTKRSVLVIYKEQRPQLKNTLHTAFHRAHYCRLVHGHSDFQIPLMPIFALGHGEAS